ncbi:hypothetical protein Bhyg_00510 [Pseudolycoriella hygida]|uniref:Uncharacterized protein n=1 Tax=Pseudolycoriella hygida TaxID=35572 RepID=A0A9Q0N951_9DIPT|nr:hypothetical protein Bhyg_00510 [Pseudolycoriella hygida]
MKQVQVEARGFFRQIQHPVFEFVPIYDDNLNPIIIPLKPIPVPTFPPTKSIPSVNYSASDRFTSYEDISDEDTFSAERNEEEKDDKNLSRRLNADDDNNLSLESLGCKNYPRTAKVPQKESHKQLNSNQLNFHRQLSQLRRPTRSNELHPIPLRKLPFSPQQKGYKKLPNFSNVKPQRRHFAPIIGGLTYLGAVAHDIVGHIENPFRDTFRDSNGNLNIHGNRDDNLEAKCNGRCQLQGNTRGNFEGRTEVHAEGLLQGNAKPNFNAQLSGNFGSNFNLNFGLRRSVQKCRQTIFVPIDELTDGVENLSGPTSRHKYQGTNGEQRGRVNALNVTVAFECDRFLRATSSNWPAIEYFTAVEYYQNLRVQKQRQSKDFKVFKKLFEMAFAINKEFNSFDDVLQAKKAYERENKVILVCRNSHNGKREALGKQGHSKVVDNEEKLSNEDGKKVKIKAQLMAERLQNGNSAPVLIKAIHNLQTANRVEKEKLIHGENELEKLLASMLKTDGAKVRVLRDHDDQLCYGEHSSSDFRSRNSTRFGDASVTETVSGHKEAETTLPTPDVIVNNSVVVNSPHDLPAIGSTALTSNNPQTDPFANRLVIVGPTSRELQLVELPYKRVSIGRPKGSRNTVIGIRKKKSSNKIQSSEEKTVPKRSDRIRRSKQVAQKRVL